MFDILEFIDNEEIRECNKERNFTPIEQAVLIEMSRKKSIKDKIKAWYSLLDEYSDEEFQKGIPGRRGQKNVDFKEIIRYTIQKYLKYLKYQYFTNGMVFCARLEEVSHPTTFDHGCIFSTYEKAWEYLLQEKADYLQEEKYRDIETRGIISLRWLDKTENYQKIDYIYDSDLELVQIKQLFDDDAIELNKELSQFYVRVNLPFKPGDTLRSMEPDVYGNELSGVLRYDPSSYDNYRHALKYGDRSDMKLTLENVCLSNIVNRYEHYHVSFLDMEKVPENLR